MTVVIDTSKDPPEAIFDLTQGNDATLVFDLKNDDGTVFDLSSWVLSSLVPVRLSPGAIRSVYFLAPVIVGSPTLGQVSVSISPQNSLKIASGTLWSDIKATKTDGTRSKVFVRLKYKMSPAVIHV